MGWLIEVIFRRFWSGNNAEHRWVNPGFLKGPWLPVYGLGLTFLYLLSSLARYFFAGGIITSISLVLIMTVGATVVEYVSGVFSKRVLHASLWDYSREWGNLEGLICPRFTFFWLILSAAYFFLLHRPLSILVSSSSSFSLPLLALGIYLGLFSSDVISSTRLAEAAKQFFKKV